MHENQRVIMGKGVSHIVFLCISHFFSHSIEYMRIVGIETKGFKLRLSPSDLMSAISDKLVRTDFPELHFY